MNRIDIIKQIALYENRGNKRIVICTQQAEPVLVAIAPSTDNGNSQDVKIKKYPIAKLTKDQIVDTNGAGDAFVGGFLA